MSRPWNSSVQLQVDAQGVRATLRPARLQRKGLAWATHRADTAPTTATVVAESLLNEPLSPVIETVLDELKLRSGARNTCLRAMLTDARVHFDVVAGNYGACSDGQLQSIAQACVSELLGEAAPGHEVRWQLQPDATHLLISAIERQDIEAVAQAAALRGLRLISLQPEFCVRWNQHVSALRDGTGVFAVASAMHALVAWAVRGSITAVSYGPWTPTGPAEADQTAPRNALDTRVDRLLASVGQDANHVADFLLVTSPPVVAAPSQRWTVCNPQQEVV